jgi:hypothetical protein
MADPTGVEENILRLDAFVAEVSTTRRHLAAFLSASEGVADRLADQTALLEGRLEVVGQSVVSLTQSFETHHQHTLTELGALALAGTQVTEHAVGGARGRLEEMEGGFVRGLEHTREDLHRTGQQLAEVAGHAGHAAEELEERQSGHGQVLQEAGGALRSGVLEAGEQTHATGTDVLSTLDAARTHVTEGLEGYLAPSFATFLSDLSERLQPLLADALGEVSRTVLRCLDDLDGLVEASAGRLAEETEPALREVAGRLSDWTRDMSRRLEASGQEAVRPYTIEVERHVGVIRKGQETATELSHLAPHLATARHVADRLQDMMDLMNPFG